MIRTSLLLFALLIAGVSFAQKRSTPEAAEKNMMASLNGADLFSAHCATCHGKEAKGNGPMAALLKTPPPDLTGIARRNKGTFPFLRVQRIMSGEELSNQSHGTREMPIWGPILSEISWDQDLGRIRIYALAKYLESIQTK